MVNRVCSLIHNSALSLSTGGSTICIKKYLPLLNYKPYERGGLFLFESISQSNVSVGGADTLTCTVAEILVLSINYRRVFYVSQKY
jgi:hypothetical protein